MQQSESGSTAAPVEAKNRGKSSGPPSGKQSASRLSRTRTTGRPMRLKKKSDAKVKCYQLAITRTTAATRAST